MSSTIGRNIRRLRVEKGMTQEQLAQSLHVTRQAVSLWETGKTLPDIQMLQNIGTLFGRDLQSLVDGGPAGDEKRRRMWKIAGLAACLALGVAVLLALEAVVGQYKRQGNLLALYVRSANITLIRPAIWCLWGWCGIRSILYWAGRWPAQRWQRTVMAVSAVLCAAYLVGALVDELCFYGLPVIWELHHAISRLQSQGWLFITLGIALGQWPGKQH